MYLINKMIDEYRENLSDKTQYERVYQLGEKHYSLKVNFNYDEIEEFQREEYEVKLEDIGLIEALWNIFGGTISEQGYKVLDEHIGAIYGDSITLERAKQIVEGLERKGFASINVVLGIGSYTYTYNTRDTLGFAIKATYAQINGEEKLLFKDPKTDDGTKRSQRGRVVVYKENGVIKFEDGLNIETEKQLEKEKGNLLQTVFENGKLLRNQSLAEIRELLNE